MDDLQKHYPPFRTQLDKRDAVKYNTYERNLLCKLVLHTVLLDALRVGN